MHYETRKLFQFISIHPQPRTTVKTFFLHDFFFFYFSFTHLVNCCECMHWFFIKISVLKSLLSFNSAIFCSLSFYHIISPHCNEHFIRPIDTENIFFLFCSFLLLLLILFNFRDGSWWWRKKNMKIIIYRRKSIRVHSMATTEDWEGSKINCHAVMLVRRQKFIGNEWNEGDNI